MKILQHDIISDIWKLNVFNIMYYFALLWFSDITVSDFQSPISHPLQMWFRVIQRFGLSYGYLMAQLMDLYCSGIIGKGNDCKYVVSEIHSHVYSLVFCSGVGTRTTREESLGWVLVRASKLIWDKSPSQESVSHSRSFLVDYRMSLKSFVTCFSGFTWQKEPSVDWESSKLS